MNQLKIFKKEQFGEIRVVVKNNEPWFVANDVCRILDLGNPRQALARIDEDEKGVISTDTLGGKQNLNVVNESGLYSLVLGSRKPEAKEFKRWLTHEVIPTLRKSGTYSIKPAPKEDAQIARAKAMELNARTRAAQTWLKIAASVSSPEYKQIASTYAANTLADKEVLSLPETLTKTYTATEVGKMLGVSSNRIGKLANANGLKTKDYGMEVWDKSPYSAKQIPTWRYYESAIPVLKKLLSEPPEPGKGGAAQ